MWVQNSDTGKWTFQTETLTKSNYDNLKQDMESVRLYSKILSGATYLPINKFDNIYDILDYKTNENWFVDSTYSSVGSTPSVAPTPINGTSSYDYYNKELAEYGFTLKNLFTPVKLINDSVNNFYFVDLATSEPIDDLNASLPTLIVDGVIAKNGHRILVKNQISYANLAVGVDPTTYFTGNFYKYQDNVTYITYYYYDNTNGVYKYDNNKLVREDDLNAYTQSHRYSVSVKSGTTYADKQFSLSRLLNGYYPTVNDTDPIEFTETHNYVVKNRVDYNNIYSVNYNDLITHGTQSVFFNSMTYTVTPRTLAVGNFGVIINNQDGFSSSNISHIIPNKYKDNIHSINQNNNFYWTCGDNGTLLKISKLDFSIERINLNEINKLNCIYFLNDIKGVVVGDFNTIYTTDDGGYNWKKISFEVFDAYSYNTVYYYNLTKFYVGGDNGVFIEFNFDGSEWIAYKRKIKKTLTPGDDYNLVEDINDIKYRKYTTWGLTYSHSGGTGISSIKEMLFIATNNDNLILYNMNSFVPEFSFMYLTWTQSHSDISNILISGHTIYLGGDNVYKFTIDDFTMVGTSSNVLVSTTGSTVMFNGSTNRMNINNNSAYITLAGNFGLLDTLNVTSSTYTPLDNSFVNSINPKMLFLDYDIASKLNFFDGNNEYVLPSTGALTSSYLISGTVSSFSITNITTENNWINYYQDVDKTFAYYTSIDDVNSVIFSTTFSYASSSSFTFSANDITNNISIIKNFAPNVDSKTASRFIQGTTSITSLYAATYSVMMYRYLTVFKRPTSDNFNVGDVLNISNDIIDCNFKINRMLTISYSATQSYNYLYCYTDFNNSIINSLTNYAGIITVNNLNKYNSLNQLISNFNNHTIGIGYEMTNDSNNIYINGKLNNKTAYYNLQALTSLTASSNGALISVIAGSGPAGSYSKINFVPALSAQFNCPMGLDIDSNGNIYIADVFNNMIRKYTATSSMVSPVANNSGISGFSGDGGVALSAKLYEPTATMLDNSESFLYVADELNNRVRRIDFTTGVIELICGTAISGGFSGDGGHPAYAYLSAPGALAIDSTNNIYIADKANNRIRKITVATVSSGIISTIAGTATPGFSGDGGSSLASQIDINTSIDTSGFAQVGLACDSSDNLYFTDVNNNRVRKIDNSTGIITTIAGNGSIGHPVDGTSATTQPLTSPSCMAIDSLDNIYFIEGGFRYVRKVDVSGTVSTVVDVGVGYMNAVGLAIDSSNHVYISIRSATTSTNLNQILKIGGATGGTTHIVSTMSYPDNFINFGYTPTYNILDYLENIDNTKFTAGKTHYAMPKLYNLSGNVGNSFTSSTVYMDLNYPTNKMIFGNGLKLEYDSIWIDTFVDVNLMTTVPPSLTISTFSTTRMLVTKKYIDDATGGYVIEFDNKFNVTYGSGLVVNYIDILSRNTLYQISSDLQQLNNIQRSSRTKTIQSSHTITNLENELNSKISTDSYAKILLSDNDYKSTLTSLIYVDYKKELSMNVANLDKKYTIPIVNTGTYSNLPNLRITCSEPHNLNTNDAVVLTFNGGTGSSQFVNTNYTGYQTITVIDNYNFYTTKNFGTPVTVSDTGFVNYYKIDPFFNYEPVDLINVGIDKNVKTAIAINPENYQLDGNNFNLINLDLNKYRYQLTDNLSIADINSKFTWILDADVTDAIIGQNENGLVWYSGIWNGGRWFNGSWYSGTWVSGDWYSGNWYSYKTNYVNLKSQVDTINIADTHSKWLDGRWFGGTWSGGTWYNGRRYDGNWMRGFWHNGIWNDGTWFDGTWMGGIWVYGVWKDGSFNCDNKPSYWINGNWYGGDFENGIWYNGIFNQTKDKLSRFGTNASNTRTALWHGGTWVTGEFHSRLNLDINGKTLNSVNNKYSMFKTGNWLSGYWYGGIAININFNSSNWNSGILDEIEIIGIDSANNNLILNGVFRFNINDTVYIIDNNAGNSYSIIGSNTTPGKYLVADTAFYNNTTILTINANLPSLLGGSVNISNIDTGLRMVSYFKNSNWNKGVWYNGIFENGSFNGGMWYNGVFNGIWNL